VDNELTGNDDILNLDAVSDFQGTSSIVGSYEFPIAPWVSYLGTDRLRGRVYASWDEYTARDLGFTGNNFSGNDQTVGLEATYNIYNYRTFFLDAIQGGRFQHLQVKSAIEQSNANVDYFIPYLGLRAQDDRQTFSYFAAANVEGGFGGDSEQVLSNLGRVKPTRDWLVVQPSGQLSVFLEPLLFPDAFNSGQSTLAHEFVILGHAQYAFDARLAPQFEETVGGFATVRGYPEAETAGDTVYVGTAEYRFHIPRALGIEPNPSTILGEPFRWAPQQPYQRPDWDLIFRAFLDAGRVTQDQILPGESNDTLVGAGAGLELQLRQNIDIRGDWGMALTNIKNGTQAGSNRFTLIMTLLY
jgi:hemolysin activation/secretion protein